MREPLSNAARLFACLPMLFVIACSSNSNDDGGTHDSGTKRNDAGDSGHWDSGVDGGDDGGAYALHLTVASPPVRVTIDGGIEISDDDARSFLRLGFAVVDVELDGPANPESVTLKLRGTDDAGTAQTLSVVACPPGSTLARYCATANLDLSGPAFDTLRGEMNVDAEADLGDAGSVKSTVKVPVTRVHWVHAFGGDGLTVQTPALRASDGMLYMNLSSFLWALHPDGTIAWTNGGYVHSSPVLGDDLLFGALTFTLPLLGRTPSAFDPNTGVFVANCYANRPFTLDVTPTLVHRANKDILVGVAAYKDGGTSWSDFYAWDGASSNCTLNYHFEDVPSAFANLATSGTTAAYVASDGSLLMMDVAGNGSSSNPTSAIKFSSPASWPIAGNGEFSVADVTGIFNISTSGAVNSSLPLSTSHQPGALIVDAAGTSYFSDQIGHFFKVGKTQALGVTVTTPGNVVNAGALGQGNYVYVVDKSGALTVYDRDLNVKWTASLPSTGGFSSAPTLDCARDANHAAIPRPGTLYLVGADRSVYSIVVDSHGLDATASWPKFQHDERNTGNSSVPIASCP